MTASAWRTSAGTAARIRVARCTNLVRTLKDYAAKGLMIAGLDADGTTDTDSFELATSPLVIVVGSEGRGLARLTLTVCDVTVSIPMARTVESLNASVAAGVVLAEVARRRRVEPPADAADPGHDDAAGAARPTRAAACGSCGSATETGQTTGTAPEAFNRSPVVGSNRWHVLVVGDRGAAPSSPAAGGSGRRCG